MSTKDIHEPMSDKEAQEEFDDIQAEIAKEKGLPLEESPEKKEEKEEPADLETEESEEKSEEADETQDEDDEPALEQERQPKGDRAKVPLSKYQETKKTLEAEKQAITAEKEALQSKVEELTLELNRSNTSKKVGDKVKAFAEKHGMAEDAVLDLVQLVKGENELDTATKDIIKKSELALKKQEAEEKFSQELADFIADNPDAKGREDEIRAKAFEKGNLDKSLFEIFYRFVKTEEPVKRKTGEVTRGASRQTTSKFDAAKTAADIENGKVSIKNLTEEQVDEVFNYMEKTGSRYLK